MANDRPGAGSPGRDSEKVPELIEVSVSPTELITTLARLDLEAALAYDAAAQLSTEADVKERLAAFAQDHRRHVTELNQLLAEEEEPVVSMDTMGPPVLAGLMRVAGPLGPDVIVVALLGNEQLTNLSYDGALAYEWDDETEKLLERFAADEQRHLRWLAQKHDQIAGHAPESDRPIAGA